jgi:biopolymer transport protein TolR
MSNNNNENEDRIFRKCGKMMPANINVTPMIDVLLVLLIIFMIAAPIKPAKFETRVPSKPGTDISPAPELLMVVLGGGSGAEQSVSLNSKAMPVAELQEKLKGVLEGRPNRTVYIKAPKSKKYEDVMAVIDVVKAAGAAPIGLQIDYLE